jgi:large subunit ribosomal protein L13e
MAIKHNNVIPNVHFRKWWQKYVKCFFNQAGKKKSRRVKRQQKAALTFPRPTGGLLRPVVHPPTVRYNFKVREGRGFTLEELKKAGVPKKKASSIGISVDHRRKNFTQESLDTNANRLKEYLSKMVVFPLKSKAKKGDTSKEKLKTVTQNTERQILKIDQKRGVMPAPQAITAEMKAASAWKILRTGRAEKRNFGRMIKLAAQRAKEDQKNAK